MLQTMNCSVIVSYENVPFQDDFAGGFLDGTFINAQVELYHTGNIEFRWGAASLPTLPPPRNGIVQSTFYDASFYVQETENVTDAFPTNQCRFYKLVKPVSTKRMHGVGKVEVRLSQNQTQPRTHMLHLWYGFDTTEIVVGTEMTVLLGPSTDPRTGSPSSDVSQSVDPRTGSPPFNIGTSVSAGLPLGFGRPGFIPSASLESKIIVFDDDEKLIISWEKIPFNVLGGTGFVNSQVLLYFNGDIEIRWGPAEMPNFDDSQEEIGEFQSHVRDFTFYVQDETWATGSQIGDDGVWSAGQWPENQCRFFQAC
jgi:hypothetical protein